MSTDDELEINEVSPPSSPVHSMAGATSPNSIHMGISDETVARFIEMGFSNEMIARAIEENSGAKMEPMVILETLVKYSTSSEASSSKSKVIDDLIGMGFSEDMVIKAIQEYGEENMDEITNALLSYGEAEKLHQTENENININHTLDNDDEEDLYSLSSSEENELNSSHGDSRLQALIKLDYSKHEASKAIERCGENASMAEVIDFISAAQMARQLDEFSDEKEPIISNKKRRTYNEQPRRGKKPMIGFGVPSEPGLMTQRPVPIHDVAHGPPYFYYENVARTPRGVWATISRHLYDIKPEFVDSKYFCAAARKRGYVHNLPIKNRFQIKPLPPDTIQEVFPLTKEWWPTWDERTKFNCLLTSTANAQITKKIRADLEKYDGEPPLHVRKDVIKQCKRWNMVWVGKNKVAPLEPYEMEEILGFPRDHTRGVSTRDRYKALGNSFQVDTVAYHLSVLKPMFPNGIKVLSLFTGIGGGEVALYRLRIPMKVVVSVEISEANRNILRSFWEQTKQRGTLREFRDVEELDDRTIEQLMEEYGGFDLVIGGSPCNNLAGTNRVSRDGLEGEQSSLFYDYCRILGTVRRKALQMRRSEL